MWLRPVSWSIGVLLACCCVATASQPLPFAELGFMPLGIAAGLDGNGDPRLFVASIDDGRATVWQVTPDTGVVEPIWKDDTEPSSASLVLSAAGENVILIRQQPVVLARRNGG